MTVHWRKIREVCWPVNLSLQVAFVCSVPISHPCEFGYYFWNSAARGVKGIRHNFEFIHDLVYVMLETHWWSDNDGVRQCGTCAKGWYRYGCGGSKPGSCRKVHKNVWYGCLNGWWSSLSFVEEFSCCTHASEHFEVDRMGQSHNTHLQILANKPERCVRYRVWAVYGTFMHYHTEIYHCMMVVWCCV